MIHLAIAEDHREMRAAIRLLLRLSPNIDVVCEASTGQQAIEHVQQHQPDVLLMDVFMPGLDGLKATRQITDLSLPTRVILISFGERRAFIKAAISAGAWGYLPKHNLIESLLIAIETVHRGDRYFPED